jgi:hypothetical protein
MKTVARWLLRLFAFGTQIFIAACYGPPAVYRSLLYKGRVLDADTKQPIVGIQVTCREPIGADGGLAPGPAELTDAGGGFLLATPLACVELEVRDVDGPANGSYAPAVFASVTAAGAGQDLLVHKTP